MSAEKPIAPLGAHVIQLGNADAASLGVASQRREWLAETVIVVGLAALSAIACLPVIFSGDRWGFWDWDIFESNFEAARASIMHYGQLPGWNPYMRGGESLVSHPLMPLCSPSFLVVLAFGTPSSDRHHSKRTLGSAAKPCVDNRFIAGVPRESDMAHRRGHSYPNGPHCCVDPGAPGLLGLLQQVD